MSRALLPVSLTALVASACLDVTIPAGAEITCSNGACPTGMLCQPLLDVCVAADAVDQRPPSLSAGPSLSPAKGALGAVFTLTFSPDEALSADPVVSIDVGAGRVAPFTKDDDHTATDDAAYRYEYTANGTETEGSPATVRIVLIDVALNPSDPIAGGSLVFDFSPPALVGAPRILPELARAGQQVTLDVDASESLSETSPPTVDLFGPDGAVVPMTTTDDAHFTYTPAAGDADGLYTARVTLTDEVGNVAAELFAGELIIDATAPAVVQTTLLAPTIRRLDPLDALPGVVVGSGAVVVVSFATDEAPAAPPLVEAVCADGRHAFTQQGQGATAFTYAYTLSPAPQDGTCTVDASLQDAAGNPRSGALGLSFVVDKTAPLPPNTESASAIRYDRAPFGTASDGRKRFTITGEASVVEASATVRVFEALDAPSTDEIAHVIAGADGAFGAAGTFALPPVDRARVYVSQRDRAGNESARRLVRDVAWTAALNDKVAGSDLENPFLVEARPVFTTARDAFAPTELGAAEGIGALDGTAAKTDGAGRWVDATIARDPTMRLENGAAAYDPLRGRIVVAAADACHCRFSACEKTSERNGVVWSQPLASDPEGDGTPGPLSGPAIAFDGDVDGLALYGDGRLWRYDGFSFKDLCTGTCAATAPPARTDAAMAWDPIRHRLVLFGGTTGGVLGDLGDTWEFDGAQWQRMCADGQCAPAARHDHGMVWDDVNERVVMFGGSQGGDALWAWSGGAWTPLCQDAACSASRPSSRSGFGMAYDRGRGVVVVHGGVSPTELRPECGASDRLTTYDETWEFDGALWSPGPALHPVDTDDPGWIGHSLVYDESRGTVVLVGGAPGDQCDFLECPHIIADTPTWEYDGVQWQLFDGARPTGAEGRAMAYDTTAEATFLFDGDVWRWDSAWTKLGASSMGVTGADIAQLSGGGLYAQGGRNASSTVISTALEVQDGVEQSACRTTACIANAPGQRFDHVVQRAAGGTTLIMGGYGSDGTTPRGDIRSWNGSTYSVLCGVVAACGPTTPVHMTGAASAYDAGRGVTVLFGGGDSGSFLPSLSTNELWEWNGAAWTNRTATDSPVARSDASMTYDVARQRVVLYGGQNFGFFSALCEDGSPLCGHVWEWDGAWREPFIVDPEGDGAPTARALASFAYDEHHDAAVLHGGTGGQDETWLWEGGGASRPGQVVSFSFLRAGTASAEQLIDVTVRATAGGTGVPASGLTPGAQLLAWDGLAWRVVDENTASADAPASLAWSYASEPFGATPASIARLFQGRARALVIALVPKGLGGALSPGGAIATDAIEATVRYRLPAEGN